MTDAQADVAMTIALACCSTTFGCDRMRPHTEQVASLKTGVIAICKHFQNDEIDEAQRRLETFRRKRGGS